MLVLLASLALSAEIDRAPSGAIVTIRPTPTEKVAIVDVRTSCEIEDPPEMPQEVWIVNVESWRKAVALSEKVSILERLPEEQARIIEELEAERDRERALRSELRIDLEAKSTEAVMLRRSRTHWLIGGLVVGAVAGAAGVGVVAF